MEEKNVNLTDDELIEDIKTDDDAPVEVIYRCKKCGQILTSKAKDCWKCSSKEIEVVVEEETKEIKKVMLQARLDKAEAEIKTLKKNNDILYIICVFAAVLAIVAIISAR